jgi:hypothetical protein
VWNIVDDEPAPGTEWVPAFAGALDAPVPAVQQSGDVGRPVLNARSRAQGFSPRFSSWRTGFVVL